MLDAIRTSSQSWWVRGIFILLIATFILWGVGTALLPSGSTIATINGYAIKQEQFLERLQQEKQSIVKENPNITEGMLEEMGIRKQILNNLIIRHLLLTEAENIGLFVSNETLRKKIMTLPLFKNQEGKFDSTTYANILKTNKAGVLRFEEDLRNDILIQKLVELVSGSSFITDNTAEQMYTFLNEERSVEYVFFPSTRYFNTVSVSEKEKKDFYQANLMLWEQPQRMRIEYIPITTETILESISIPQERITTYYNNNKEQYKDMQEGEARKAIATQLKEQQIPNAKEDILDRIQLLRSEGKSFQEIAKAMNLPIEYVEPLPIEEIEQFVAIPNGSLKKYSTSPNKTILIDPFPLRNKGDSVFIHIVENIQASTPTLEDVDNDVEQTLRTEKAIAKAKEEALGIKTQGKFPSNGVKSILFPRFNPPLELPTRSEEFIQDVFTTRKGDMTKNVYTTTQGAILTRVSDIMAVPPTEWEQDKKNFIRQIENVQGELLFRAFQNYLFSKAKIVITNETLLEPSTLE